MRRDIQNIDDDIVRKKRLIEQILCSDADIPLEVWTVNDKNAILALSPYVSGVTSDSQIASEIFYDSDIGG